MNGKLQVKKPVYPLFGILAAALILVFGMLSAKSFNCLFLLGGVWLLFLCFGYFRACLVVLPFAAVLGAALAAATYAVSHDTNSAFAAANRIFTVCAAVIPGLALSPIHLARNLSQLKFPRMLILGMMITLSFFPMFSQETARVREAMKTRGAGNLLNPKIFYRAFLVPLTVRLVNISDTLSLSVETRGFTAGKSNYTVYKPVKLRFVDVLFLLAVIIGCVLAVAL